MKGAHSAKKAAKPKKADKAKKKKSGSSGVGLKVDPEIIRSTLAAKPAQDEKEQSAKKAGKSAHGVKKKPKREPRVDGAGRGRKALVACIVIAVIALACLVAALATHTIDLSMDPDEPEAPAEQVEETTEPQEGTPSSDARQMEDNAPALDGLVEDGRYRNSRFGFSVEVPEGFHVESLIDGGDGIILANDALDMTVRVTGANNLDGRSAQDVLDDIWTQGDDTIGRAEGNRVIVYQYDEMSEYFYWVYVGSGSIDQMVIEYPVHDDNGAELSMAQQLMRGFIPGRINRQH